VGAGAIVDAPSCFHLGAMRKTKLVCWHCAAPVKADGRSCDCCGVAYPTSELRAVILSPFALAFYVVAVLNFITLLLWHF
jgi:hypothetical protein